MLYDAARARLSDAPDASDSRVIKAVLLNSADKTIGWDNRQVPHPNGLGGVLTESALDARVGAGRMNLSRAFDQFLAGTTDVPGTPAGGLGNVHTTGWDFGLAAAGEPNDYYLDQPLSAGTIFNATLNWQHEHQYVAYGAQRDTLRYANLDLELWSVVDGLPRDQIAASVTPYNNTEHFSFAIPASGRYLLRVRWQGEYYDYTSDPADPTGPDADFYGLAWSATIVPEPSAAWLATTALAAGALRIVRRRKAQICTPVPSSTKVPRATMAVPSSRYPRVARSRLSAA